MSAAVFIPWENRLAKVMRKPGGVRVEDALQRADENLEDIREECLASVDEQLDQIERMAREAGASPTEPASLAIYQLSNDIHAVAGVFGLTELGHAAFSLCELVDRLRARGRWSQPAVEVHLSAFRLLRNPDGATDRSAVLDGLRRVTEHVPVAPIED